jgi:hypothetical protein
MNPTSILERSVAPDEAKGPLPESARAFNIAVIYRGSSGRSWATPLCRRLTHQVGRELVRQTWWEIHRLKDPALLAEATRAAEQADMIVVSIHDAEELPIRLCAWVDKEVHQQHLLTQALTTLISLARQEGARYFHSHEYLRAITRKGGLDVLLRECILPQTSRGFLYLKKPAHAA